MNIDFNGTANLPSSLGYRSSHFNNFECEYLPVVGEISNPSLTVCQILKSDLQLDDLGRFSPDRKPGVKIVTEKSDAPCMIILI
jgi:hypothetical protein